MSKIILKTAALLGASIFMVACSDGGKGKFVNACQASLVEQVRDKEEAKVACTCIHQRLNEELSGKQMSMATKIMSLENQGAVEEFVQKNKGGTLVAERIQGAVKSCAGGGF